MEYEIKKLAADWSWFIDLDEYELHAISPFGDLLLMDREGTFKLLEINSGELLVSTKPGENPTILFPDYFDDRLASSYRRAQLFLAQGQCYGYTTPVVLGGSYEVENVWAAPLQETISLMASIHFQIKDMKDGQRVKITVRRDK